MQYILNIIAIIGIYLSLSHFGCAGCNFDTKPIPKKTLDLCDMGC